MNSWLRSPPIGPVVGDDQNSKKPDGQGNGCGSGGSGRDDNNSQSDGSQSDNQNQAGYQKTPDPKTLLGIFKKHRGGDNDS